MAALLAPALCAQSEFAEAEEFSRASEAAMRTAMRLLRLPRFTSAPAGRATRPSALREAVSLYEEKGNVVSAAKAHTLLGRIVS